MPEKLSTSTVQDPFRGAGGAHEPDQAAAVPGTHDARLGALERWNAKGWVSQDGVFDGMWKNARWAPLRTLIKPLRLVRAFVPTVQASLGGFILGSLATAAGAAKRGIQGCFGKPVPEQISVPLSSAPDPTRKIKQGSLEDVQQHLKYTAAMEFIYQPFRNVHKVMLSSDSAGTMGKETAPFNVAAAHAMQQVKGQDRWDYKVVGGADFPPANDPKAQAFWDKLPSEIKDNINEHGVYADPRTGNIIGILYDRRSGEIVITHGGSGAKPSKDSDYEGTHGRGNVANWFGLSDAPPSVKQSVAFSKLVREAAAEAGIVDDKGEVNVVDVGHSRGGLMAQAAALASHGRAVCSNAEPMGAATQRYVGLGVNQTKDASTRITQLSHEHDVVSNQVGLRRVGQGFRFLTGLPTQANAGDFIALPGMSHAGPWSKEKFQMEHASAFFQAVEAANQLGYQRRLLEDFETLREALKLRDSGEAMLSDTPFDYRDEVKEAAAICLQHIRREEVDASDSTYNFLSFIVNRPDVRQGHIGKNYRTNEQAMWAALEKSLVRVEADMGTKQANMIFRYRGDNREGFYAARHSHRPDAPRPAAAPPGPSGDNIGASSQQLSGSAAPSRPAVAGTAYPVQPDWDAEVAIEKTSGKRVESPRVHGMRLDQVRRLQAAANRIGQLHERLVDSSSGSAHLLDEKAVLSLRRQLELKEPFSTASVRNKLEELKNQLLHASVLDPKISDEDCRRALAQLEIPASDLQTRSPAT